MGGVRRENSRCVNISSQCNYNGKRTHENEAGLLLSSRGARSVVELLEQRVGVVGGVVLDNLLREALPDGLDVLVQTQLLVGFQLLRAREDGKPSAWRSRWEHVHVSRRAHQDALQASALHERLARLGLIW